MAPLNILVIGCSIAGPTLATFLLLSELPASQKPHITILERSSAVRKEGQNIDIRGSGISIMRKLGLETAVRASTTGEDGVQWVDEKNRVWIELAADRTGRQSTPTADIEILRGHLAQLCYLRSKTVSEEVQKDGGAGIEYIFGDYLDELEQDSTKVRVRFARSQQRRSFDLVVGADGLQSSTRKLTWGSAGEEERLKRLGMYSGYFSMPRGETDTSWRRWFHTTRRRGIMLRPDEQNRRTTVSIYVVNDEDSRLVEAAGRGNKGVETQKRLLEEYFCDAGWESKRVLREMMEAKDFYYDLVGQVKMESWSKGRVVLLGDAGYVYLRAADSHVSKKISLTLDRYCASPLSGMGTTLAFNGAYELAGALSRHPNDYSNAFTEYEQKMRPLVDRAQKLAPGIVYTLNPDTAWGLWILYVVMWMIAQSGLVTLLFKFKGPPTEAAPVEDYGFRQLPELVGVSHED